jgi:signal peptidase I
MSSKEEMRHEERMRRLEEQIRRTKERGEPRQRSSIVPRLDSLPEKKTRDSLRTLLAQLTRLEHRIRKRRGPKEEREEPKKKTRMRLRVLLTSLARFQRRIRDRKGPEEEREEPKKKTREGLRFLLALLATFALLFGVVRPFIVEAFYVPTESMVPTLLINERVLANKFIYDFVEPDRGNIIVFESKDEDGEEMNLVKRVVGLPGDQVAVQNGVLFLNGMPQRESYLNPDLPDESSFGPMWVPPEHVFVMGDNRADSADSRVFGPVPEKNIVGEAFLRVWPPSRLALL